MKGSVAAVGGRDLSTVCGRILVRKTSTPYVGGLFCSTSWELEGARPKYLRWAFFVRLFYVSSGRTEKYLTASRQLVSRVYGKTSFWKVLVVATGWCVGLILITR